MTDDRSTTLPSTRGRPVHRRDCLKALAAGLVAAQASSLQAGPLLDKAKKNIRLGIDGGVYARFPVEEAASRIKDAGFRSVLCSYSFADARLDPLANDWGPAKKIVTAFEKHGITIAAAFGYANLIDPNSARLEREKARMHALLQNWKRLGCNNISTETGTYNESSPWMDSPENFTEKGYLAARDALAKLARDAEKFGAVISIEAYWRNCISSIERAERLFREVDCPALKLVMDPCNYYRKEDLPQMQPMLEDMFKKMGGRIAVAHAKDVKAAPSGTDLPAAGLGVLDYPLFLRLLAQLDRPMDLILEHLTLEDMPRARAFVLAQLEKV
jgi:sugar phosphate isomerase/epimerase